MTCRVCKQMIKEELLINLSGIKDKETFHNYVSKKLNFPSYYGRNLDAFWDCITDENQSDMPKILIVEGLDGLKASLPDIVL